MPVTHKIKFLPNPVQDRFIRSSARADLFSSRMGEGKSAALCWANAFHTRDNFLKTGVKSKWALVRDTWENMQKTTMEEFFKWFPPGGGLGYYRAQARQFVWSAEQQGLMGTVTFMGLDDAKDAAKLQSLEIAGFGIDEPAPVEDTGGVSETIFDVALSRLRQPNVDHYSAKLATNNPDETHWVYRRFVDPGSEAFICHHTDRPENIHNLPVGYYEDLARDWQHRPDLQRRFLEGKYGFQQRGKSVTPEWNDEIHLAPGHLRPMRGQQLILLWDFGLTPACIITQISPEGRWLFLDGIVGDDVGTYELINDQVRPLLTSKYDEWFRKGKVTDRRGMMTIRHIGDPQGKQRDQSSKRNSALREIKREIGGPWKDGAVSLSARIQPLRAVLRRLTGGAGVIQVDRHHCKPVWHALRGGWHYNVSTSGIVSDEPEKDAHSHPGDAVSYGASVLFPLGRLAQRRGTGRGFQQPSYEWGEASGSSERRGPLGFERPGLKLPADARKI